MVNILQVCGKSTVFFGYLEGLYMITLGGFCSWWIRQTLPDKSKSFATGAVLGIASITIWLFVT